MEVGKIKGVEFKDKTGTPPGVHAPFKLEKFDHENPIYGFRTVARKTVLAATDEEINNGTVTFLSRRRPSTGRVQKKTDCGRHIATVVKDGAIHIMHAMKGLRVKAFGGIHTQHQLKVGEQAQGFLQFLRGHA
jgi:hypothetical protein